MAINPAIIAQKYASVAPNVVQAVQKAAQSTGMDFDFLMDKARVESGYNPNIKASTSSATGLYQFISSTWLKTVKDHGAQHGLGDVAAQITERNGQYSVADPAARDKILNLRKNPEVAALMAAEFSKDNQAYLQKNVGGQIGANELYLAHFLGAGGAAKFLDAWRNNPQAYAADLMPAAASANKNVFYADGGLRKRSLDDVYQFFAGRMGGDNAPVQVVQAKPVSPVFNSMAPMDGFNALLAQNDDVSATMASLPSLQSIMSQLWHNGAPAEGEGMLAQNSLQGASLTAYTAYWLAEWHKDQVDGFERGRV